ncbi:MAG: hypothetical protein GY849_13605 [Deltaproteobacteria bacterium]|nr:hypothetical protein [Deltaproteobacteria bacterium]
MDLLIQALVLANIAANLLGRVLLAPVAILSGTLSLTVISAATGVALLLIFKYTSNQTAISRVQDEIRANLLAIRLFKDSMSVTVKSQGCVLKGVFKLLFCAVVPMLVMIAPVCLILAQLGLWYQHKPLTARGKPFVVKMSLNDTMAALPAVQLAPAPAAEIMAGPVRVPSRNEIYWKLKPLKDGRHQLHFELDDQRFTKEVVIGEGFMRISPTRPARRFGAVLLNPLEEPFDRESAVQSITVFYPERESRIHGADWWLLFFFIASLIFAFLFKPFFKVRI